MWICRTFCTIAKVYAHIYSKWVGLRLKVGPFKHKMPHGFISFTSVHPKWPKLVPDFIKTLNRTLQSKTNCFLMLKMSVLFRYRTILCCSSPTYFHLVQYRRYLAVCLSMCLCVCMCVCLYVCMSVCLYVCMSVCVWQTLDALSEAFQ